jgi:hypothetical protein
MRSRMSCSGLLAVMQARVDGSADEPLTTD